MGRVGVGMPRLGILFGAFSILASTTAACFDSSHHSAAKFILPTDADHFRSDELIDVWVKNGESTSASVTIQFQSPDSWEIESQGGESFPGQVIIVGDRGWVFERNRWSESDADALRLTRLSFTSAIEHMATTEPEAILDGPGRANEETVLYVYERPDLGKSMVDALIRAWQDSGQPKDASDRLIGAYEAVRGRWELVVGKETRRVHSFRFLAEGPSLRAEIALTFDYESPVSVMPPGN